VNGLGSASLGEQPFSGYGNGGESGQPRGGEGTLARRRRHERKTREIVQQLSGCLAGLSRRERLALELITGVDVPHVFGKRQIAAVLHIRGAKLARLERIAIARLRRLADTTSCAGTAQTAQTAPTMQLTSYTAALTSSTAEAARGGVAGVRYAQAPSGGGSSANKQGGGSPLASIPASHADDTLLVLFATLLATLAIGLLSADAVGTGPRSRRWRVRWLGAPRRAWRRRKRT
jgi:hypothetical protein